MGKWLCKLCQERAILIWRFLLHLFWLDEGLKAMNASEFVEAKKGVYR